MSRSKPWRLNNGDSLLITKQTTHFLLGCCDCELTHKIDVTATSKGTKLTFFRDERRTTQRRRRKKEQVVIGENNERITKTGCPEQSRRGI